ncbi:DNA sulfur modification protein DndE [Luteolibacter marinus]|uniref:DNA sulfur modification protein DndE n=1 Tax=Luteolibacter marinus TaxID=2776705 RepID=UPI001868DD2E|nr:DNA sulfur modification protein DndE [Luteolibacter marinus]
MKPPVDTVRVSERGREILISAKRRTGIENWNTLCRWALSASLAVKTPPKPIPTGPDSNIEMAWKVFGGPISDLLAALLATRQNAEAASHNLDSGAYFRAHLERGIGYLNQPKSIDALIEWGRGFVSGSTNSGSH